MNKPLHVTFALVAAATVQCPRKSMLLRLLSKRWR